MRRFLLLIMGEEESEVSGGGQLAVLLQQQQILERIEANIADTVLGQKHLTSRRAKAAIPSIMAQYAVPTTVVVIGPRGLKPMGLKLAMALMESSQESCFFSSAIGSPSSFTLSW
jgi:hypothetical protein